MAIEVLDDPFSNYPELRKEREKLRRIEAFKEKGYKGHGGYRPGAGRPKETQKTLYFKILVDKKDEESVIKELNNIRNTYENINTNVSSNTDPS